MPRRARLVFPGLPHHVTQRGNHRQQVFFAAGDQETYLRLLREHAGRHDVQIQAYCLMANHVHVVVVPKAPSGLARLFKAVHGQYAQRINRMRGLKGHLWQGRHFSSTLDSNYFLNAVRYVELNPVRAGIVARAEIYPWSSAAAHCGLRNDPIVEPRPPYEPFAGISDWASWLAEGVDTEQLAVLRDGGKRNLPCGSASFVASLESSAGRRLTRQKPGPRR
jgi:putative transposase